MRAICSAVCVILFLGRLMAPPAWPQDPPATAASDDNAWPREYTADKNTVTMYQPQIDKWDNNRLEARVAVSVQTEAAAQPTFGVVWIGARTEVDKGKGLVTLEDIEILKTDFPKETDQTADYGAIVKQCVPLASRTVSLSRLEANLAVTQAEQTQKRASVPLKNDPPRIILSATPALLVLIDGAPVLRNVEGTNLLRTINTRALLLMDQDSGKYYLRLQGRWMEAAAVNGPWTIAQNPPASLDKAKDAAGKQVDLLDKPEGEPTSDTPPTVYVSTTPAELIETQGKPGFAPIDGTQILVVKNTSSHVFFDLTGQKYYVLVSGRWFRAQTLQGPWDFVPANALPPDFARIPETHPKGDALVSVAGTPQANEAVISNDIPQTATVKRSEAALTVSYDGKPQFKKIDKTNLHYAANTATPVIQCEGRYYAVQNGVWFLSDAPTGPWGVAAVVPGEIYTIPPTSPLYYVTYVHVYGSTPEVVYVGYRPGYFGTCLAEESVVVYGTGYVYEPWVGAVWYGPPVTYGFGAGFSYGFASGFALGFWAGHYWHPWWGPYWGWHDWHNRVYINNVNVYNHWGRNVVVPHDRPIVHPVTAGRSAHGDVYAGRDGKAYRRADNGQWHRYDGKDGWNAVSHEGQRKTEGLGQTRPQEASHTRTAESPQRLDREEWGRSRGENRESFSRPSTFDRSGGFRGGSFGGGGFGGGGGFRGRGGRR